MLVSVLLFLTLIGLFNIMTTLALIIDDEPDISELLEITLERMNIECRSADYASRICTCLMVAA